MPCAFLSSHPKKTGTPKTTLPLVGGLECHTACHLIQIRGLNPPKATDRVKTRKHHTNLRKTQGTHPLFSFLFEHNPKNGSGQLAMVGFVSKWRTPEMVGFLFAFHTQNGCPQQRTHPIHTPERRTRDLLGELVLPPFATKSWTHACSVRAPVK